MEPESESLTLTISLSRTELSDESQLVVDPSLSDLYLAYTALISSFRELDDLYWGRGH